MREITYRQALNEALAEELARDPNVFLMGEEVAEYNGAYKVSQGLLEENRRVVGEAGDQLLQLLLVEDDRFREILVVGECAGDRQLGDAVVQPRPDEGPVDVEGPHQAGLCRVGEVDLRDAHLPRELRHGGVRVTGRARLFPSNGPAHQLGATHSHATECLYANIPGLKICTPATPRDAKGLLKTAIRDNNPVLVLESELLYSS